MIIIVSRNDIFATIGRCNIYKLIRNTFKELLKEIAFVYIEMSSINFKP